MKQDCAKHINDVKQDCTKHISNVKYDRATRGRYARFDCAKSTSEVFVTCKLGAARDYLFG